MKGEKKLKYIVGSPTQSPVSPFLGATETKLEAAAIVTIVVNRYRSLRGLLMLFLLSPPMKTLRFEIVRDQVIFFA